jgi:hypothetical protein
MSVRSFAAGARWARVIAASLAMSMAMISAASPADAALDGSPPNEPDDVVSVVDEDVLSEISPESPDFSLSSVWSSADPYEVDPFVAWREITTIPVGIHPWEVWRCDIPDVSKSLSTAAVIAGLEDDVTDWFEKMSRGRYTPTFVAKGGYAAPNLYGCVDLGYSPYGSEGTPDDRGFIGVTEYGGMQGMGTPGVLHYTNSPPSLRLREGTRRLAVGGLDLRYDGSLVPYPAIDVVVHEMGHALGWPHVPLQGSSDPYTNAGDMMSGLGSTTAAVNLYAAGWIDRSEVSLWESGRSSFRLGGHLTSRTQMVVVPTDDRGVYYTISAPAADYDEVASSGVAVHFVDQSGSGDGYCLDGLACTLASRVVEAVPPPGHNSSSAPVLRAGETMTLGSWQVEVTAAHSDGFSVELSGTAGGTLEPVAPETATGGPFADVGSDHIFVSAIRRLADAGITQGCNPPDNTRFCPDDYVTRGEMAAFLARALDLPASNGSNRFADDDDSVFQGAIERLAQAGATVGCNPPDNTNYCPDNQVTRGEMAALLARSLGLTAYSGSDRFDDDNGSVFQGAIERLAQAGVTVGCNPPDNTNFCPDDSVTRGQMATFLVRADLTD